MKYGSSDLPFDPDRACSKLSHLEPAVGTSAAAFLELLIQHLPLEGIRRLGIVVADKTRLCEYPTYLPVLTSYLEENGISPSSITFHIAYGTHAPQSREESLDAYGESFNKFRFIHHNSRDQTGFIHLGLTTRGSSVKINKEVLQYDRIITFGAILHHYFAGYGGGRKMLFPGLAAYDSILENHRLFLDFEQMSIRGGCESGELDQNPLAQDLEEIHQMLPPHLEIHAILNSQKRVCELYAGVAYEVFREVCQRYDSFFRRRGGQQFDLVVASAGGFPKDINFIQAHKSIHNAAAFVKNGGKLVIFAECRDGIGNQQFMEMFHWGDRKAIFSQLSDGYRNNAGTAISMLEKSSRIQIFMVTSLDEATCRMMGTTPCLIDEAREIVEKEKGSMAIIENAGMLYR